MLDGEEWFEVLEEVIGIPEYTPQSAIETTPCSAETTLEVNEVIVVSEDEDGDEWLVVPSEPLVSDNNPSTPTTPPSPVYEPFTGTWTVKTWHQPNTPSGTLYKNENDAKFMSVFVRLLTNQRPFSGPPKRPFQGHQILQKEFFHILL
ncbi:hypothetical protein SNE40_004014 [Patella caerulea]